MWEGCPIHRFSRYMSLPIPTSRNGTSHSPAPQRVIQFLQAGKTGLVLKVLEFSVQMQIWTESIERTFLDSAKNLLVVINLLILILFFELSFLSPRLTEPIVHINWSIHSRWFYIRRILFSLFVGLSKIRGQP